MWAAVLLAGLATYLLRVLPLFVLGRFELPERVSEALQHAAMGAMAVMLVTGAAQAAGVGGGGGGDAGGGGSPDAHTADPMSMLGRPLAVIAGVGLALLLARRGRSMPVVVLAALAAYAATSWAAVVLAAHVG